jgi:hypothetical protein
VRAEEHEHTVKKVLGLESKHLGVLEDHEDGREDELLDRIGEGAAKDERTSQSAWSSHRCYQEASVHVNLYGKIER